MNGGNGTISASLALAHYLRNHGAECSVIDFMKEVDPLGNVLAEIYNSLLRRDLRFATMYMELAHHLPFDDFESANILTGRKILNLIQRENADVLVLICPWIIDPVVKALRKKKGKSPRVYTVVVDLGNDMASNWFSEGVDYTILPTKQARDFLKHFGLNDRTSAIMGMPLTPEILAASSRPEYLADVREPLCTVMGGREGGCNSLKIVDLLLKSHLDMDLLIQCGKNERLAKAASRRARIKVIGFPQSIIPLLQASSVVITKPGALTISELITLRKPFILDTYPTIMPQERGNVEFVQEEKCGLVARRIEEIPPMVQHLHGSHKFRYPEIYGTDRIGKFILEN
jgi:processive 1,2-diacylglycerol beta-glucosyltransferase